MTAKPKKNIDRADALRENLQALFGLGVPEPDHLRTILGKVAPEDVAAILADFPDDERLLIFRALPDDEDRGVVIEETDQDSHDEILEQMTREEKVSVIGEMAVDDLVDHIEELPEEEKAEILATLEPDEARDVEELAKYPSDSAGGLMTTELLSVSIDLTSRDALTEVQGNLDAEVISYVYVVQDGDLLRGVVSIRDLLRAKPQTPIRDYMATDIISVDATTDQEEVARVANKYNLTVIPVVDDAQRICGIVTSDDIIDALEEEHSEDMLRMAGTVEEHPYHESVFAGALKRLPFLFVTMAGGIMVAMLPDHFSDRISGRVLLWVIAALPLVCALAGNVAIVTATVMVRGLATGEINQQRTVKAIIRETMIGSLLGIVLATVAGFIMSTRGGGPQGPPHDPWVLFAALSSGLTLGILWASFVGALVPLGCRLTGKIDPAIASGPFVTMLCDLSASFIFLSIVVYLLGKS